MAEAKEIDEAKLRQLVFTAMDNAVENGEGDLMRCGGVDTVAIDLLDYDVAIFETVQADSLLKMPAVMDLIPHIEAWRAERAGPAQLQERANG